MLFQGLATLLRREVSDGGQEKIIIIIIITNIIKNNIINIITNIIILIAVVQRVETAMIVAMRPIDLLIDNKCAAASSGCLTCLLSYSKRNHQKTLGRGSLSLLFRQHI